MSLRRNPVLFRALLAVCWVCGVAAAAEASASYAGAEQRLIDNLVLVWDTPTWGPTLIAFSAAILALIVLCTNNAGNAYRASNVQALRKLPPNLAPEGLSELHDKPETGPLHRALKVGLVGGRSGLLISKSAVLAAWAAERERFKAWPRVLLALGLLSLALGLFSATNQLPRALDAWIEIQPRMQYAALNEAYVLLTWGMTNCLVAQSLFFLFERVTQGYLDRATLALIRYLGQTGEVDVLPRPPAATAPREQA